MTQHTRIKICGLTRAEDVRTALAEGADALGFVFYPQSPRYVTPEAAAALVMLVPDSVITVGLFVNATPDEVIDTVARAPVSLLQFHGDETPDQCALIAATTKRPFLRAFRVKPASTPDDLLQYEQAYRAASAYFAGLLLDTHVDSYGGSGKVFDWSLISKELAPRVVLSGGLNAQNVTGAIAQVRPFAVDISSGVELTKGIKDADKIRAFISAVRQADAAQ